MSILTSEKVELISSIVPPSEIETFGHKIMALQVENHFVNKGMKDLEHTGLFLFTQKELEELSERGLVAITTTKENDIYTQGVVGYAVAVPSEMEIKNQLVKKIFQKLEIEEEKFFLVDAFMSSPTKTSGKALLRMMKELEESIGTGTKVFCPIYAGNRHFKRIVKIFDLNFEYGPGQTLETSIGVIHLPCKILTA